MPQCPGPGWDGCKPTAHAVLGDTAHPRQKAATRMTDRMEGPSCAALEHPHQRARRPLRSLPAGSGSGGQGGLNNLARARRDVEGPAFERRDVVLGQQGHSRTQLRTRARQSKGPSLDAGTGREAWPDVHTTCKVSRVRVRLCTLFHQAAYDRLQPYEARAHAHACTCTSCAELPT